MVNGLAVPLSPNDKRVAHFVFLDQTGGKIDYAEMAPEFDSAYEEMNDVEKVRARKRVKSAVEYLSRKIEKSAGRGKILIAGNSQVFVDPSVKIQASADVVQPA